MSDSENDTSMIIRPGNENDEFLETDRRKVTAMSDADLLRLAYGNDVVLAPDGSETLLIGGVRFPKKRIRTLSDGECDEHYEQMHTQLLKAAKLIVEKDQTLNVVRRALENATAGGTTTAGTAAGTTAAVTGTDADDDSDAWPPQPRPPPLQQPGRRLFTIAKDHDHAVLGTVRVRCVSWSDSIQLNESVRIVARDKLHSGFPHAVRLGRSGANEQFVEHSRSFDVCAEIKYLCGGVFKDTNEILDHANAWTASSTVDASELRFEMYLIYASGDGRRGRDDDKPFASSDETSHFRPGMCFAKDSTGKTCTNLFTNFNPKNSKEVFYGTCTRGKIIFSNLQFRKDALSSNVLAGDGSFRFVIRATHPSLRHLVNYTTLSEKFYVGARVRATTRTSECP